MKYAQVLVFWEIRLGASPVLDYSIPDGMAVQPGHLVRVPVRQRSLPGLVLTLLDNPSVPHPRPIEALLSAEPLVNETQLALAHWLAESTLTPLHLCVRLFLPPGQRPRVEWEYTARVKRIPPGLALSAEARQLLELLWQRGTVRGAQARRMLPTSALRHARLELLRHQLIRVHRGVGWAGGGRAPIRYVQLLRPPEAWDAGLHGLRLPVYRAILELLQAEAVPLDVALVYAQCAAQVQHLKTLAERGLVALLDRLPSSAPLDWRFVPSDVPPVLTPDQATAWERLAAWLAEPLPGAPVLLWGVTGSGKTELYLRATQYVLGQGRQALILVPEISLTPQMVARFERRFPHQVGVWHSGLSPRERRLIWEQIRSGVLRILIGARSALFAPFRDLGLLVLDEEEAESYRNLRRPFYHAREVAIALARHSRALVILGSATPSLESYQRALDGHYRLLSLPQRVLADRRMVQAWGVSGMRAAAGDAPDAYPLPLPQVQIVDLRAELKAGNRSIFSRSLQAAVDAALARQEQVILFLNRRGTATHVFCRDCGWTATCPRCAVPLVLHAGIGHLVCHHCNHRRQLPARCPECGSARVKAFGLGTEGLEAQVRERWPQARLLRWDRDTVRDAALHATLLSRFAGGEADMLIGTQMLARGLDFPRVTVVGIIAADTGLQLPDFRATERTFQLLTQVAGRAGRSYLGGQVIVQTYMPEHPVFLYVARHDYAGFAEQELALRRSLGYPPAVRLVRLMYRHPQEERARRAAEHLAESLRQQGITAPDLIGPAPAFFARLRGRSRWQILIRCADPLDLVSRLEIPPGWSVELDPYEVL